MIPPFTPLQAIYYCISQAKSVYNILKFFNCVTVVHLSPWEHERQAKKVQKRGPML